MESSPPKQNPNSESGDSDPSRPSRDANPDKNGASSSSVQQNPNQLEIEDSSSALQSIQNPILSSPPIEIPKLIPEAAGIQIRTKLSEYTESEIEDLISYFPTFFGHEIHFDEEEEEESEDEEPGSPQNYPGFHPLPEPLKSRMIKTQIPDSVTPIMCADPDDESTWKYFPKIRKSQRKRCFSPNTRPLKPGNVISGIPIFELISIRILYIDINRGFSAVIMVCEDTQYVPLLIYKVPKGENTTLGKPLPLKGPFRPLSALDHITFFLSNPFIHGWCFDYERVHPEDTEKIVYNKIVDAEISDGYSDSKAQISYELIEFAAIAELCITYEPHGRNPPANDAHDKMPAADILNLSGTIYATNTDKPETKRLVQDFSSVTLLNKVLPLNRSVFGVPTNSGLQLSMDFKGFERGKPFKVKRALTFMAQPQTCSVQEYLFLRVGELKVTVNWWDNMCSD